MSQPTAYEPATSFQQEEQNAVAGRSTVRTAMVDAELQAIALTLSEVLANLAIIQRDDTNLQDEVVTTESLSAQVKTLISTTGINPRGPWLTATTYAVKDVIETGTPAVSYVCIVAHTSGTFATDRAAGKWMVLGQEPGVTSLSSLTLTTGGLSLGTNNTQDLAATANRFRDGWFGRTLTAATSLVSPIVDSGSATDLLLKRNGSTIVTVGATGASVIALTTPSVKSSGAVDLVFGANGGSDWILDAAAKNWTPTLDAGQEIGSLSVRLATIFTVGVCSGAADLTLRTGSNFQQVKVINTAASNRSITLTGSNGGNPTIGTTAGNLAISATVVLTTAVSKIIPGATSFSHRNTADGEDNLFISDGGLLGIRDNSNANMTVGLTINQGAADNEILSFKSSDVAHGMTSVAETDTYASFAKFQAAGGGVMITGLNSGSNAGIFLRGAQTTADTTKSTAGLGVITLNGVLKSGTSVGSMGANANIAVITDNGTTRFILDADGDSHQDVGTAWTNFDDHDDIALLDSIAIAVARPGDPLRDAFILELESRRDQIESLPGKAVVTFNEDGHHFVNMSRLVMLQHGAIRQLAGRISSMERKLLL